MHVFESFLVCSEQSFSCESHCIVPDHLDLLKPNDCLQICGSNIETGIVECVLSFEIIYAILFLHLLLSLLVSISTSSMTSYRQENVVKIRVICTNHSTLNRREVVSKKQRERRHQPKCSQMLPFIRRS